MISYISRRSRPEAWRDLNDAPAIDSCAKTVYEPDAAPIHTGLLDARGVPLYRIETREPIGFISFMSESLKG